MEGKESAGRAACLGFFFRSIKRAMNTRRNTVEGMPEAHDHQSRNRNTSTFQVHMHVHLDMKMTIEMK